MGKISILTKDQTAFLSVLATSSYIKERFYFTGGTVLSEYYLRHRYSDDLDFFSEEKFDNAVILTLIETWSKQLHYTFTSRFIEVVYRFVLTFPSGIPLKIDFSYYPYKRLSPGKKLPNGITIDSRFDIAVNKMATVSQRMDIKDYVDCYYLWQKESFYDLIHGREKKFHIPYEPLLFSSDLLTIETFTELPRMITPVTLPVLKMFFRKKAKELAQASVIP
jgi:predicted nucleotidyltransferase component of viral defense system